MNNTEQKIKENMERIKHKIIVLSNKGGVGKSTVSAYLAAELAYKGYSVGLLDADLHGPSQAKIFGVENSKFEVTGTPENMNIAPLMISPKLKLATTAAIIENVETPLVWRGPLKIGLIKQFLGDVIWGQLDFLLIDSPPGTGDEPLTIMQTVKDIALAVIVTTPQEMALLDSKKAVNFIKQFNIPHIAIIENMSEFTCPHCGGKYAHFSSDGGQQAAKDMGVKFLGKIPFVDAMMHSMEDGSLKNLRSDQEFAGITDKLINIIKS